MNRHLDPVFNILLPGLDKVGISYWVYGGISVAALAGQFIRKNEDVDIFIKEVDYLNANSVLEKLCAENGFRFDQCKPLPNGRPKLNIVINNKERLSIVPVYMKGAGVKFKFDGNSEEYPNLILEKVHRNISGYRFITPPDKCIKTLFKNYLASRSDKKNKPKLRKDAETILSPEELAEIYG